MCHYRQSLANLSVAMFKVFLISYKSNLVRKELKVRGVNPVMLHREQTRNCPPYPWPWAKFHQSPTPRVTTRKRPPPTGQNIFAPFSPRTNSGPYLAMNLSGTGKDASDTFDFIANCFAIIMILSHYVSYHPKNGVMKRVKPTHENDLIIMLRNVTLRPTVFFSAFKNVRWMTFSFIWRSVCGCSAYWIGPIRLYYYSICISQALSTLNH